MGGVIINCFDIYLKHLVILLYQKIRHEEKDGTKSHQLNKIIKLIFSDF